MMVEFVLGPVDGLRADVGVDCYRLCFPTHPEWFNIFADTSNTGSYVYERTSESEFMFAGVS